MFIPLFRGLITDQAEELSVAFGISFDVQNIFALRWFDEYTFAFAEQVAEVTRGVLEDVIRQGRAEGQGIAQMQNRIEDLFRQWMKGDLTPEQFEWFEERMPAHRTEMIARTETIRAGNRGHIEQYKAWGVKWEEWLTAIDERTCPWCRLLDGERYLVGTVIGKDGVQFTGGSQWSVPVQVGNETVMKTIKFNYPKDNPEDIVSPPLHPNCRCRLIPWMEEWAEWDARREAEETE